MLNILEIRRKIHKNPELGNQEFATSRLIQECLTSLEIPFQSIAGTGVVGLIDNHKDKTLLLRADIDALPIQENTGLPYASKNNGVMHACGHDFHIAMLLGAAQELVQKREQLSCNVKVVFQPDEEGDGGAKRMIDEYVLENPIVDGALAFHVWPDLPFGTVGIKTGPLTATGDTFTIKLSGSGGHIADGNILPNPIVAANEIITELHSINLENPHRLGICNINSGTGADNIIPHECTISGGMRVLTPVDREKWQEEMASIVNRVAKKYNIQGEFTSKIFSGYPPMINDEKLTSAISEIVRPKAKIESIAKPYFIAEDFASFGAAVPSSLILLGCSSQENLGKNALHKADFVADERVIDLGIDIFTNFILNFK